MRLSSVICSNFGVNLFLGQERLLRKIIRNYSLRILFPESTVNISKGALMTHSGSRYNWLLETYQYTIDFLICTLGFRLCKHLYHILQDDYDFTT